MKKNIFIILLAILVALMLVMVNCGPPPTPEPTPAPTEHPGKAIVGSRCIGCHSLNQFENTTFNERGWRLVVDRMVLLGAQLTEEQVVQVVDYMVQTYPYDKE